MESVCDQNWAQHDSKTISGFGYARKKFISHSRIKRLKSKLGSGDQNFMLGTLTCRMASFLCGHEVFQITASATYGLVEFKADLLALYAKAGGKGTKVTFLLTDTNIVNERFLVYINDLLSTGYIADLCTPVSLSSLTFVNSSGTAIKHANAIQCVHFALSLRTFLGALMA